MIFTEVDKIALIEAACSVFSCWRSVGVTIEPGTIGLRATSTGFELELDFFKWHLGEIPIDIASLTASSLG